MTPGLTSHIDVALVCLYAFWLFFFCLIVYLQRESRREGFPTVADNPLEAAARRGDLGLSTPPRKVYRMDFAGLVYVPDRERDDDRPIAAVPAFTAPGAPLVPTGNPLVDGIGPASYAFRANVTERTAHGTDRIVPFRVSEEHFLAAPDADPRGMQVIAADGRLAGIVTDLWVDRSEGLIRYLEIELSDRAVVTRSLEQGPAAFEDTDVTPAVWQRRVLMPIGFGSISGRRRRVDVGAITAAQFGDVPRLSHPSRITLSEEDRVVAYFGGGALYATPKRAEPLL